MGWLGAPTVANGSVYPIRCEVCQPVARGDADIEFLMRFTQSIHSRYQPACAKRRRDADRQEIESLHQMPSNLLTDRGQRHMQLLRSLPEAEVAGRDLEGTQRVQWRQADAHRVFMNVSE